LTIPAALRLERPRKRVNRLSLAGRLGHQTSAPPVSASEVAAAHLERGASLPDTYFL
jgi:hypothetical protein